MHEIYTAFLRASNVGGRRVKMERLAELDDEQLHALVALDSDVDQFQASGTEILWTRHVSAGDSLPTGDLERALDLQATRRNLNTIRRMVAKFS
jgi:uncharacterized protein (DUF1697 family)